MTFDPDFIEAETHRNQAIASSVIDRLIGECQTRYPDAPEVISHYVQTRSTEFMKDILMTEAIQARIDALENA